MSDSAPEQMVELLMRDTEHRLEAVGDHGVLAFLPLHSLFFVTLNSVKLSPDLINPHSLMDCEGHELQFL